MEEKEFLENTSVNQEGTENVAKEATLADLIGGEDNAFSAKIATQGEEKQENVAKNASTDEPKKKRTFKSWLFSLIPTKRSVASLVDSLEENKRKSAPPFIGGSTFVKRTKTK